MTGHFIKIRRQELVFLAVLCSFAFLLSIFRVLMTNSLMFLFLNWNLFLAFIPWGVTTLAISNHKKINHTLFGCYLIIWLVFFPNSLYILTDLFHLKSGSIMVWYDLVLIMSFAWAGLMFGFLSLCNIEKLMIKRIKPWTIGLFSSLLIFLGSFGVYIGRFLRWNSWDIITEPLSLFYQISERLINPFEHPRTWGMTILMGILLNLIYWSFKFRFSSNPEIRTAFYKKHELY